MKKVLFFRKPSHLVIQGVAQAGVVYVGVGQLAPPSEMHGAGVISEMELQGNNILVRKTMDGKPHRNFGKVAVGNKVTVLAGDYALIPVTMTEGLVVEEEAEQKAKKSEATWKEAIDEALAKRAAGAKLNAGDAKLLDTCDRARAINAQPSK